MGAWRMSRAQEVFVSVTMTVRHYALSTMIVIWSIQQLYSWAMLLMLYVKVSP